MKLKIAVGMLLALVLSGVAQAAAPAFKQGLQYTLITPQPPQREGQEVEVIEFFWYGCPHCNSLEPYMERWAEKKPDYVRFVRMPAPFSGPAMLHAKAFYALQVMGEGERLHPLFFEAMHVKNLKLDSVDALVDFVAGHGVDGAKFRQALDSFAVQTQLNRASVLAKRYGIRGVPALVVDGRYKSGKGFTSYGEFTELVDYLAAKTLQERQGAAASNQ